MKNTGYITFTCLLGTLLFLAFGVLAIDSSRAMAAPAVVSELEHTPLPKIQVPKIHKTRLKNGMRVMMLFDDEMPVVRGFLYIRTGFIYDPADASGLAQITGQLLRAGGAGKLSSGAFNERLAAMGAEISSGIDRDYGFVQFKCLSEDLPEVLEMVFSLLREPAFEIDKLELVKRQLMESIKRQNDKPADLAIRKFRELVYGAENIYARTPTLQSVQNITREQVVQFYRRYYYPNRIIFAVSGEFSQRELLNRLNELSKGWSKAPKPLPNIPLLQKTWEAGVYFAPKKTDQVTMIIGHYGERRFNPDKYALLLLNDILGGDVMSSRLGRRIRSTLGLAYGIYSNFGFHTDYGIFSIFAQTKAVSANQVLDEIRKILDGIVEGKTLTQQEVEEHKQSVVNSLYAQYEPRFNFVRDEARFEYFGYPANYLEVFRKKIQKVTLADLRRVAKKYLKPDALKVLVVGETGPQGAKTLEID